MTNIVETLPWQRLYEQHITSLRPSDAYIRQWNRPSLVQIRAQFSLLCVNPLPEPMMTYCKLDPAEQTSMKFSTKLKLFRKWWPVCFSPISLTVTNVSNVWFLSLFNNWQRQFYGLSGTVKFDDYGLRTGYSLDVLEITFNRGMTKVGI